MPFHESKRFLGSGMVGEVAGCEQTHTHTDRQTLIRLRSTRRMTAFRRREQRRRRCRKKRPRRRARRSATRNATNRAKAISARIAAPAQPTPAGPSSSSYDFRKKTLRERVLHLLVLKPMSKAELLRRLNDQTGSASVTPDSVSVILREIAALRGSRLRQD